MECPCKECKTRTVTCHSICPSYKKWCRENIRSKALEKKRKRECGGGIYLDFNSNTRW